MVVLEVNTFSSLYLIYSFSWRFCFSCGSVLVGLVVLRSTKWLKVVLDGEFANSTDRLYKNSTTSCSSFQFTGRALFQGRIWFWGFVCLFFTLGIIGCFCFCFCREKGSSSPDSFDDYRHRGDCWWIWCGPTYYGGYYYTSPYGYWTGNDILCLWLMMDMNRHSYYHSTNTNCCDCNSCNGNCGGCDLSGSNCGGDKDGLSAIAVIIIVVVILVVVCGVIFGGIIAFLLVNKVLRRHLHFLQKKQEADTNMIVDLDNPQQLAQATNYSASDMVHETTAFTKPYSTYSKDGYDVV